MSERRRRARASAVTVPATNMGTALAASHDTQSPLKSSPPETSSTSLRMPTRNATNNGRNQRWTVAGAMRSMRSKFMSTATITTTRYMR
jgi:hypothetical protein